MKNYELCLSNQDCIFDSATFDDAKAAADWATGRGGTYVIQGNNGLNVKVDDRDDVEKLFVENFDGYDEISESDLVKMIERLG